jgi:hypothetical protein
MWSARYRILHQSGRQPTSPAWWDDLLTARPDILHDLLGDLWGQAYGPDEPGDWGRLVSLVCGSDEND